MKKVVETTKSLLVKMLEYNINGLTFQLNKTVGLKDVNVNENTFLLNKIKDYRSVLNKVKVLEESDVEALNSNFLKTTIFVAFVMGQYQYIDFETAKLNTELIKKESKSPVQSYPQIFKNFSY